MVEASGINIPMEPSFYGVDRSIDPAILRKVENILTNFFNGKDSAGNEVSLQQTLKNLCLYYVTTNKAIADIAVKNAGALMTGSMNNEEIRNRAEQLAFALYLARVPATKMYESISGLNLSQITRNKIARDVREVFPQRTELTKRVAHVAEEFSKQPLEPPKHPLTDHTLTQQSAPKKPSRMQRAMEAITKFPRKAKAVLSKVTIHSHHYTKGQPSEATALAKTALHPPLPTARPISHATVQTQDSKKSRFQKVMGKTSTAYGENQRLKITKNTLNEIDLKMKKASLKTAEETINVLTSLRNIEIPDKKKISPAQEELIINARNTAQVSAIQEFLNNVNSMISNNSFTKLSNQEKQELFRQLETLKEFIPKERWDLFLRCQDIQIELCPEERRPELIEKILHRATSRLDDSPLPPGTNILSKKFLELFNDSKKLDQATALLTETYLNQPKLFPSAKQVLQFLMHEQVERMFKQGSSAPQTNKAVLYDVLNYMADRVTTSKTEMHEIMSLYGKLSSLGGDTDHTLSFFEDFATRPEASYPGTRPEILDMRATELVNIIIKKGPFATAEEIRGAYRAITSLANRAETADDFESVQKQYKEVQELYAKVSDPRDQAISRGAQINAEAAMNRPSTAKQLFLERDKARQEAQKELETLIKSSQELQNKGHINETDILLFLDLINSKASEIAKKKSPNPELVKELNKILLSTLNSSGVKECIEKNSQKLSYPCNVMIRKTLNL
jgi:hypothetical protein